VKYTELYRARIQLAIILSFIYCIQYQYLIDLPLELARNLEDKFGVMDFLITLSIHTKPQLKGDVGLFDPLVYHSTHLNIAHNRPAELSFGGRSVSF
jgi:hypothetical protein